MQPATQPPASSPLARHIVLAAVVIIYPVLLFLTAWLCDDAYITLRTVDNWVNGFGLRWNVAERVQTFTHPLWMLLVAVPYAVTREDFFTLVALSIATALPGYYLLLRFLCRDLPAAAAAGFVLCASAAFVDYSTSGLENPLTHLLLVLFCMAILRPAVTSRALLATSLCTGLLMLTRPDTLLLVAPALAATLWRWNNHRARVAGVPWRAAPLLTRGVWIAAAGFIPFLLWTGFALYYYGFLFPNTAYAKLNTGFPSHALFSRGLGYLASFALSDTLSAAVVVMGIVVPLATRNRRTLPIAAGLLLHTIYLVRIGGDFMAGRFLSPSVMLAVVVITWHGCGLPARVHRLIVVAASAAFLINLPLRLDQFFPTSAQRTFDRWGIANERSFFKESHSLWVRLTGERTMELTERLGREIAEKRQRGVFAHVAVGFLGYHAGPPAHIVDLMALTDPLLARLNAERAVDWRPGHFLRTSPRGYATSLMEDRNRIHDRELAMYYDRLLVLTRAPLDQRGRVAEIWRFNTGHYGRISERYPPFRMATPAEMGQLATAETDDGTTATTVSIALDLNGLELPALEQTSSAWIIHLEGNDDYRVEFRTGDTVVASVRVPASDPEPERHSARSLTPAPPRPKSPPSSHLRRVVVRVPPKALRRGYTAVRVVPEIGITPWRVGRMEPDPASPLPAFRGARSGI